MVALSNVGIAVGPLEAAKKEKPPGGRPDGRRERKMGADQRLVE